MTVRALVTGVTGQDGSYLAELLLAKGYEVHCILRPQTEGVHDARPAYLRDILGKAHLHHADLGDAPALYRICRDATPDEIYHLGGPTRVDSNLSGRAVTFQTIFGSTRALLEAIQDRTGVRFFLAGSSEIFGAPLASPQSETAARNPRSLYGFAKLAATDLIARQRRRSVVMASTGILYYHESPRREPFFLSRKVTRGLARVALGLQENIHLGNLEARRDWGYAPDYVEAIWRITTNAVPDDYVVATGRTHSVRDLVAAVCRVLGLDMEKCVLQDSAFFRATESVTLCGDASRLAAATGWKPTRDFSGMIEEMTLADLELEKAHVAAKHG